MTVVLTIALVGCGVAGDDEVARSTPDATASQPTSTATAPAAAPAPPASTSQEPPTVTTPRPNWLGLRTLPTDGDGFGVADETPAELADRRFATVDTLPPPPDGRFHATVQTLSAVPEALARSTWVEGCPVPPEELAYVTVSFLGFDGLNHTGEIIVASSVADDIVSVFETLHAERFPIEEMRIVTQADLDAPPTGDTNNTTAFVCRPVTGGTAFSEHAKGLAVDVNPFLNPYVKGERVLPELALVNTDRALERPGMIEPGVVVVEAFADIGWAWGGDWTSLKDYQHFSATGG
ncbi:MAG: M15 family metallopeptidase [Acidimicrobiia bacterium]|nr:M15 family metallopeptidase [Acidimicrobiia bacterium]